MFVKVIGCDVFLLDIINLIIIIILILVIFSFELRIIFYDFLVKILLCLVFINIDCRF